MHLAFVCHETNRRCICFTESVSDISVSPSCSRKLLELDVKIRVSYCFRSCCCWCCCSCLMSRVCTLLLLCRRCFLKRTGSQSCEELPHIAFGTPPWCLLWVRSCTCSELGYSTVHTCIHYIQYIHYIHYIH